MAEDLEERIRRRAQEIWEREGRPEGRAEAHWEMARMEIAIADEQRNITKPNPVAEGREEAPREEPVEPLEQAVENLGEFPGLTDQGEEQQYPKRRVPKGRQR